MTTPFCCAKRAMTILSPIVTIIILATGLMTGCVSTPAQQVKSNEQPVNSHDTTLVATKASTHPLQTTKHKLCFQQRLQQLKQDQLQAQAEKAAHSKTQATLATPPNIQVNTTTTNNSGATQYTVGKNENLYAIAAKNSTYNDGLLWPLIYKANRDQIKNPEQIFPGQLLTIAHKHTELEKENAREIARNSGIFIH